MGTLPISRGSVAARTGLGKTTRWAALLALLTVSPFAPALAVDDPVVAFGLESGGTGEVVSVIDGDTVVLADGSEVRLVGIQAPKLPLGRPGFEAWPLADEAKAALETLTLGQVLSLGYGGRRTDRHGRRLAHLFDDAGIWIQGALLGDGLARVYSFADNRALIPEMLTRERRARAAGRGIWRHPFYAVRTADEAGNVIDRFALAEGVVLDTAVVRGRRYINFGEDWRTDFTVTFDRRAAPLFEEAGLDIADLEGRAVRVRGWVESYNGPLIEITHPEQIEVYP